MAVTYANLTSGTDTVDDSDSATASVTPGGDRLILLAVTSRTSISVDPNEPTASGCGLTWVSVATVIFDNSGSSRRRVTLFRAMGASPSTGAITIDFGGQTQTAKAWIVSEFSGVDTGGTHGSVAVVQSATGSGTSTTALATLAAFGDAGNATFGAFGSGHTSTFAAGSGFGDFLTASVAAEADVHTEWRNDNDTTVDMTFGTSGQWGAIGVEIKAAAASTGQPTRKRMGGMVGNPFNARGVW